MLRRPSCSVLLCLSVLIDTCTSRSYVSLRHSASVRIQHEKLGQLNASDMAPVALRSPIIGMSSDSEIKAMKSQRRTPQQQCNIIAEFGRMPLMCMKGHDRFARSQLMSHVPKFLKFWKFQQQVLPQHCCMGVNHMFALHFLVDAIKPAVIIESGVAAGHQTFMLRAAAPPQTRIFSIDPGDPAVSYPAYPGGHGYWKDTSGYTTYLTGANFLDFAAVNWGVLIPDPAVRAKTLVILDDHQSCIERIKVLKAWGFRWAFYEDNYPFKVATSADPYTCADLGTSINRDFPVPKLAFGDAYSTNAVCGGPLPKEITSFIYKDAFGNKCKLATPKDHLLNLAYLREQMGAYFEFPVLYTPCFSPRPPLLKISTADLPSMGLPTVEGEIWNYGHLFPSFIELVESARVPSNSSYPASPPP